MVYHEFDTDIQGTLNSNDLGEPLNILWVSPAGQKFYLFSKYLNKFDGLAQNVEPFTVSRECILLTFIIRDSFPSLTSNSFVERNTQDSKTADGLILCATFFKKDNGTAARLSWLLKLTENQLATILKMD